MFLIHAGFRARQAASEGMRTSYLGLMLGAEDKQPHLCALQALLGGPKLACLPFC